MSLETFLSRISLFLKLQVHVKMTTGLGHAGHIIFLGFFLLVDDVMLASY